MPSLLKSPLPVEIGPYTGTLHIYRDERGVAWIDDSNVKVVEVVLDHVQGSSPEHIHEEHSHLSLAQIYAALAYYYDNRQEIDALVQQGQASYEAGYTQPSNQAWREELRLRAAAKRAALQAEAAA